MKTWVNTFGKDRKKFGHDRHLKDLLDYLENYK